MAHKSLLKAKVALMLRAQTCFQAKRFSYAMTGTRRDNLVDDMEGYNKTLEDVFELKDTGLCETIKSALPTIKDAYGIMNDHDSDRQYTVTEIGPSPPLNSTDDVTPSDVLESKALTTFTRVQRYSLAATLASSVLQYEATPWARRWDSDAVHFPKDIASAHPGLSPQEQPFLLTPHSPAPPSTEDSFKALGTLLLELCCGKTLDERSIWQQPAFSAAKTNLMLRQFVATEWLKMQMVKLESNLQALSDGVYSKLQPYSTMTSGAQTLHSRLYGSDKLTYLVTITVSFSKLVTLTVTGSIAASALITAVIIDNTDVVLVTFTVPHGSLEEHKLAAF
ncbi:hypothetical protein B0A48_00537 [Cryoendolithus antarcticus]|uniref:DUF7580 domain-containing protein n=1 Tax=Cryoendolithus antarcticus TaxID=1507870 RepID=A0A1V8TUT9_9PEZI|nr:hypothetical protein B0A48_00537 [Cryoendolithus antarcticus]